MSKHLDENGLLYVWQKVKDIQPKKTSDLTNDSGFITADQVPSTIFPSATAPKMDGVASVGTDSNFARGDHVHPSDTSKVDKVTGKQLSTEDYTTAEKNKLAGIETNANNYTLPEATSAVLGGVKVGNNISISNGVIDVSNASTSTAGIVQLSDAVNSNSAATAATSKALKEVYDTASGKQSPATTLSGYGITDAYTKAEIDAKMSSALEYMGSKATYADLPTTGNKKGHMWNIEAADPAHGVKAGDNAIWNGTSWDITAGTVDLSGYVQATDVITNADIDRICV